MTKTRWYVIQKTMTKPNKYLLSKLTLAYLCPLEGYNIPFCSGSSTGPIETLGQDGAHTAQNSKRIMSTCISLLLSHPLKWRGKHLRMFLSQDKFVIAIFVFLPNYTIIYYQVMNCVCLHWQINDWMCQNVLQLNKIKTWFIFLEG